MTRPHYSDIKFTKSEHGYSHNLKSDFACFAIWKSGIPFINKITDILNEDFEILLKTEIEWSKEHFDDNASRLYENLINKNVLKKDRKSRHRNKIADHKFILFIIKDQKPNYTFAQSVSGKIELSNLNVVKVKYKMRDHILEKTGIKYGVHSTNSIYEFFFQVPLLLGVERFEKLIKGEKINEPIIKKDLEGANGWKNYKDVFDILNLTTNYMVQRSFETLPFENKELDIDIVTQHCQRFASAIGAEQHPKKPYKAHVQIGGEKISLDIRYIGDKYYDSVWEHNMLRRKVFKNGVYIPRADDYFFSLLYHCKVQKPQVKEKYYEILETLANELNFNWYSTEVLLDNYKTGKILNGYLNSEGYYYEDPVDPKVYKNQEVIDYLPVPIKKNVVSKPKTAKQKLKAKIGPFLPAPVKNILKRVWKILK